MARHRCHDPRPGLPGQRRDVACGARRPRPRRRPAGAGPLGSGPGLRPDVPGAEIRVGALRARRPCDGPPGAGRARRGGRRRTRLPGTRRVLVAARHRRCGANPWGGVRRRGVPASHQPGGRSAPPHPCAGRELDPRRGPPVGDPRRAAPVPARQDRRVPLRSAPPCRADPQARGRVGTGPQRDRGHRRDPRTRVARLLDPPRRDRGGDGQPWRELGTRRGDRRVRHPPSQGLRGRPGRDPRAVVGDRTQPRVRPGDPRAGSRSGRARPLTRAAHRAAGRSLVGSGWADRAGLEFRSARGAARLVRPARCRRCGHHHRRTRGSDPRRPDCRRAGHGVDRESAHSGQGPAHPGTRPRRPVLDGRTPRPRTGSRRPGPRPTRSRRRDL